MMVSPSATSAARTSDARGAQVGGQHGGGAERSFAADHGAAAFDFDVGAHAHQFLRVHEAVLENIFGDDGRAFGLRGQRHELRLQSVGKPGYSSVIMSAAVKGLSPMTRTESAVHLVFTPTSSQFAEQRVEMSGIASGDVEIASGHGAGDDEGAGLDAVGNDAVLARRSVCSRLGRGWWACRRLRSSLPSC